jgi:CRISPR-associated protein (TIGR02584 family)
MTIDLTTATVREPADYSRRVLLAVTGLSPQIVTETLYALAVARTPAFIPTEIRIVTTEEGARGARLALLSEDPGWFHAFCRDFKLSGIRFSLDDIDVIARADGSLLADIRSEADNLAAADFISETVREITADNDCALHVSIAGGRKTMGFYLGYALSLFGRTQDRLSHVLVSEPFESSRDFFYPTPSSRVMEARDKRLVDTKDAQVTLAEIPFVSLRHGLPSELLEGRGSFGAAVDAARLSVGPAELVIDLAGERIRAEGKDIHLRPSELALLAVFARRAARGESALPAPVKGVPDPEWRDRYRAEWKAIVGPMREEQSRPVRAFRDGMDGEAFSSLLSKLNRSLKHALGAAASFYQINDGGIRPRRYSLAIPPGAIKFARIVETGASVQRKLPTRKMP